MLKAPVEQINGNALYIGMHTRNFLHATQATDYSLKSRTKEEQLLDGYNYSRTKKMYQRKTV
jgi:hypothetical protein